MKVLLRYAFVLLCALPVINALGQVDSIRPLGSIAVMARPSIDSISLRWAPLNYSTWRQANIHGYRVERITLIRNQKHLDEPERTTLTSTPLRPLAENHWKSLVSQNRYAAIAAQALFGETFEVDLEHNDFVSVVNKVKENELRFNFALLTADMSIDVAKMSALSFTDKSVKEGEKYLYRIVIETASDNLQGSTFVGTDDEYSLPKPLDFSAEVDGLAVSLRWEKDNVSKYTAYKVERSEDGKTFSSISEIPLLTLSPSNQNETRFVYAVDSLREISKMHYYRVRGVSPFGDEGDASDVAIVEGKITNSEVPFIIDASNIENAAIKIEWDFSEIYNNSIKGFIVERAAKANGTYRILTAQNPLPNLARSFEDRAPEEINYYRVTAIGLKDQRFVSGVYLAQLVDSVPPLPPQNFQATVNEFGVVNLSWLENHENDLFGYRLYRSNHAEEELMQITSEPILTASFEDRVSLNTLNRFVFYSIVAVDRNQNQSALHPLLKVPIPDKIRPLPPVMLPPKNEEQVVRLAWIRSSSDDVVQYDVYRRLSGSQQSSRIKIIKATQTDSVIYFNDDSAEPGQRNFYMITSVDDSGLESEPSSSVLGFATDYDLHPPVALKTPLFDPQSRRVTVAWEYEFKVKFFLVFKAVDGGSLQLFKTVVGSKREFVDAETGRKTIKYSILALFENGRKSAMSQDVEIKID